MGAGIIGFAILVAGMFYQPKYQTSITIYADNQNVIKPLLEGQASVTMPKTERIRIVKETMFSPRFLQQVAKTSSGDSTLISGSEEMEEEIERKFKVAREGGGYIYHSDHSIPDNIGFSQYSKFFEMVNRHRN